MRISDWSSDVCSSDLAAAPQPGDRAAEDRRLRTRPPPLYRYRHECLQLLSCLRAACPGAVRHLGTSGYDRHSGARLLHQQRPRRTGGCGESLLGTAGPARWGSRSEEHTSELQSLMRISYAVFCLKKKIIIQHT